jgi:disulfide bond formation protein DsbB
MVNYLRRYFNEIGYTLALSATIASIMLSSVFEYVPCELCWYQRALMFPLPIIFFVALWRKEKNSVFYVLPISIIGSAIALYQSMLQWGWLNYDPNSCSIAVPCADAQIKLLGFMTIPFGSFLMFAAISILAIINFPKQKAKKLFDEKGANTSLLITAVIVIIAATVSLFVN